MKYKNLKDLPNCPAGTVESKHCGSPLCEWYKFGGNEYSLSFIKAHPDLFEPVEVKEDQTLMDAVAAMLRHWCTAAHCIGECKFSDNLRTAYEREKEKEEKP